MVDEIVETNAGECAPELPFQSNETFAIMFDAGLPGMPLLGCSGTLVRCGVGEGDEGLLQLVPDGEADDLDSWVFTEVQNLEESGEARSSCELSTLRLVLPAFKGQEFEVKSAWLEVPLGQVDVGSEDSIPIVLKIHGLTVAAPALVLPRRLKPSFHTRRAMARGRQTPPQTLGVVPEGGEDDEDKEHDGALETLHSHPQGDGSKKADSAAEARNRPRGRRG